jgi:hypothetical protein
MPRRDAAGGQELPEKFSEFKPGKTKARIKKLTAGSDKCTESLW